MSSPEGELANSDAQRDVSPPEPLTPVDAAWYRMETAGSRAGIVAIMRLEGEIDDRSLREATERRLLTRRRFRRRVVESAHGIAPPEWRDEEPFSYEAHVTRCRVPGPGRDADLVAFATELVNTPMDPRRAPWRTWIVDGCEGGSVLITQLHHCMGDGFALVDALVSMTDERAAEDAKPSSSRRPVRSERHPASNIEMARRAGRGLADLGHLLLLPFDPPNRLRGVPSGVLRLAWSKGVSIARVKALAKERNATLNDVLLAAITGALRRYLIACGDSIANFRAILPVNLRPASEPIDEEHGNWFGLAFVDLPVVVGDANERVAQIKQNMTRIKASQEPVVSLMVLNALGRAPAVVEHVVNEVFTRKSSIVISNVPGPRSPVSLAGHRVRDLVFWVPHPSGLSCGASILSYAGTVRVGIRSDAAVVPDPERIAQAFDDELLTWSANG